MRKPQICLGTIALETNRWSTRIPSYLVSDWIEKIQTAGFEGIELWENHVLKSDKEAEKIKESGIPVMVYNTYAGFTDSDDDKKARIKASEMINYLDAGAVKYNIGNDPKLFNEYKKNVQVFAESLPKSCALLCELHGGTLMENNNTAQVFFDGLCPQKFAIVAHPFISPEDLQTKFDYFGKRIVHIHSQLSLGDAHVCLERRAEHVNACVNIMKDSGFTGNFTIEFTELTNSPGENIDDLFANAVKDMAYIRKLWP